MTVIIGEAERKKGYWRKRMHDRLNSSFDVVLGSVNEMKAMAVSAGVDPVRLQEACMIIAHGFKQAEGVIVGQEINAPKPEEKKEEIKEVEKDGRTTNE